MAVCRAVAGVVIAEADGARLRPLKAPAEHEPVIPPAADAVVAVAGLDSVGAPHRGGLPPAGAGVRPAGQVRRKRR